MNIRRVWTALCSTWPMWLFFAVLIGMAGAYHRGASSVEPATVPMPVPIVVYVPADEHVCPEEDSCSPEWHNGRWITLREVP